MFETRGIKTMGWSRALLGAITAYTFGCGGAPPPPPAAPTSAPTAVIAATPVVEPSDPTHVVGILRWRSPQTTLDTVYKWTGIKLQGADLVSQFLDSGLAGALAFDAPVDSVVALDPQAGTDALPLVAVSVGVRSLEAARQAFQALGPLSEVRPGEYRVTLRHGKKKSDKPSCLLMSARGASQGRVLCGQRDRDVDALRGYMARTLPERDLGAADLHVELHAPPVLDVYGPMITQGLRIGAALIPRKLELGEPSFDRALARASTATSEELGTFLRDLDTLTIDVGLAAEGGNTNIALRMKGQESWTAGTMASVSSRSTPPPSFFWSLPKGASAAGYSNRADAHRTDGIRRALSELLDGFLTHEGLAQVDRAPFTAIFDDKFANDSPWVSASGAFSRETPAKPAPKNALPPDALQSSIDGMGWYIVGIGAPNPAVDLMKTIASAVTRPKFQALLRSKLGELAADSEGESHVGAPTGFTLLTTAPPKDLPKGAISYELVMTRESSRSANAGKKTPPKTLPPVKLPILIVPEAACTWIALGGDKGRLAKILLTTTQSAPESGKLASRSDLDAMKTSRHVAASYSTVQALFDSWFGSMARLARDGDASRSVDQARNMLESTPNRGRTPIMFTSDVATDKGLTWSLHFDIPKGVIEDAIVLGASSSMLIPKP